MDIQKIVNTIIHELRCIGKALTSSAKDYTPFFEELIDLAKTGESYQLFEDEDGNVIFGVRGEDGTMTYTKPDGSSYTGVVKPYSRDLIFSANDFCADSIPYTLIQLRDADTKEVVASIWRNDIDLTESDIAPANVTKGICVSLDPTLVEFQVEDCEGNIIGDPVPANMVVVVNKTTTKICNVEDLTKPITDKLDELIVANNLNSQAEQTILTAIKEKIETLTTVAEEFKEENNTNLLSVIAKLELQLAELILIKEKIEAGNVILADIKIELQTINENLVTINDTLIEKFDIVNQNLVSVITGLATINTTLQTEFDETQVKLNEIKGAIELKGSDCANKIFISDCDKQEYLDALKAIENAIIAGSKDYTAILESIDAKASNLAIIVTELQTANTTLTGIKADTAEIEISIGNLTEKVETSNTILADITLSLIHI